jgi:hypothetical protein
MLRSLKMRRIVVATVLFAAPVYAMLHPRLVSAAPAVNSTVTAAPTALRLTFQEALEPAMSRITMVDSARRAVALNAGGDVQGAGRTGSIHGHLAGCRRRRTSDARFVRIHGGRRARALIIALLFHATRVT